jgi:hypothetical protein
VFWAIVLIPVGLLLMAALAFWLAGERGHLLRPSTRGLFREIDSWGHKLHAYIYGRWTNPYVDLLLNRLPPSDKGGRWFADHYHGKVLTHDHATAIVTLNKSIPLQDLEQIVPYPVARNILLQAPTDVVAYECVCRHSRPTSRRTRPTCRRASPGRSVAGSPWRATSPGPRSGAG